LGAEIKKEKLRFHLMMNAYWEPLEFELPELDQRGRHSWRRWIDTALESPTDICDWQHAPAISERTYDVGARSVVMLFGNLDD
jgi:glycogen operon protein